MNKPTIAIIGGTSKSALKTSSEFDEHIKQSLTF